jgi:hypothetical protein
MGGFVYMIAFKLFVCGSAVVNFVKIHTAKVACVGRHSVLLVKGKKGGGVF